MKVFNEIGSKERFSEVFQKVNKVKLNEAFGQSLNPQAVLEDSFSQLKNGNLTIKHSSTQANDNESYVELIGTDREENNITFTFKAIVDESDQEGVFNVTEVGLEQFAFDSAVDDESVELSGDALKQFNVQHRNELFNVVNEYLDVKEEQPAETDEIYEDAIKRIDAVPYKGGSERMQKHKAYADEKPTNSDVRVSAEELEKFIKEEFGELPPEYVNPEDIEKGFEVNKYTDVDDEPLVDPDTVQPSEEEIPEEVRKIILQAYDNLVQKAQQQRRYGYSPTQLEVEDEILNITGQKVVKEKTRVYPKEAEPFLEAGSAKPQVLNIPSALDKQFSPETKDAYISKAKELIDAELGVEVYKIPKEVYAKAIKQYANQLMVGSLTPSGIGLNESEKEKKEKSDYPDPIGKTFKPKAQFKKKKKRPQTVVKLDETDGMSLEPETDEIEQIAQEKEKAGDAIPGGKADGKSPLEYPADQVKMGLGVEKEHSDDPLIAIEIATDHLEEFPDYYTRLDKMEKQAKEDKGEGEVKDETSEATDTQMTDVLLGYEPKNVGDDMGEEYDFATAETGYEDADAYSKFQEYQQKDFNSLSVEEKEEFFQLWLEFKDNK